ncbi:DinB family protein [Pedobacter sp. L105]|uniref:DinB family protein n=1 Tax=Pedobacter sp. L105 TaxID=1641871 RepID=UPI00131CF946|nr:DinB family protein [Pedobacter sp. L105]
MENLYVNTAITIWENQVIRAENLFQKFTNEEWLSEICPGKNRVIYIIGHLIASADHISPIIGTGTAAYPELLDIFIKNPDKAISDLPPVEQLKKLWHKTNSRISVELKTLTNEDWLQKHKTVSIEDFAKEPHRNKLSILLNRTNHLTYHIGQLTLLKK